jgi:sec-independent protein translocase protein TatC
MGLRTTTVPMNILPQFGLLRTHSTTPIRVSFPLCRRRNNKSFGKFACFAVDDELRQNQQQQLSTSSTRLGSAIEERPGMLEQNPFSLNSPCFFFTSLLLFGLNVLN